MIISIIRGGGLKNDDKYHNFFYGTNQLKMQEEEKVMWLSDQTLQLLIFEITIKICTVVSGTAGKNDDYYRKGGVRELWQKLS